MATITAALILGLATTAKVCWEPAWLGKEGMSRPNLCCCRVIKAYYSEEPPFLGNARLLSMTGLNGSYNCIGVGRNRTRSRSGGRSCSSLARQGVKKSILALAFYHRARPTLFV